MLQVEIGIDGWDSFRLYEALNLLIFFALVSLDEAGEKSIFMHPLTHAWAKDRQEPMELQSAYFWALCVISVPKYPLFWLRHRGALLPHLLAMVTINISRAFVYEPRREIVRSLLQCGRLLVTLEEYNTLANLTENLLQHLGLSKGTVDPDWLMLYE